MKLRRGRYSGAKGFTLIEAGLATVIVGTGILAALTLFATCARQNLHSQRSTVAMALANNVQEAMGSLAFFDPQRSHAVHGPESGESLATFDDLDDFNNFTASPPIDANRQPITAMSQYSQVITVRPVWPNQLSSNHNDSNPSIPASTYTGALRVRVRVMYRATPSSPAEEVYQRSWICMDR
ncbi:MAG: hypothetical protein NZ561_04090 [Phycisphaerae bacterium]|nr:hypothetical protein [Phycisphaerae bacterium]MDW8261204.1 hypothetical protein [Phycisphaerales bacterium]